MTKLAVYLHDVYTGLLSQNSKGVLSFTYDKSYVKEESIPLSVSLPVRENSFKGAVVEAFFSGVLPEEEQRKNIALAYGISKENSFALLEAIGGDCAGAVSLYPQGMAPNTNALEEKEVLSEAKIKELLSTIKSRPMLAGDDGYRLSLAGAQDKLAVGYDYENHSVILMKGIEPTTHIIKPPIENALIKDSVYNEFFCMKLAKEVGIEAPEVFLHYAEDVPYYIVERYDRKHENGAVVRIHQEDFCQALGVVPKNKYQAEGGVSIADCIELIQKNNARPAQDTIRFLERVIFNFLIGNGDAHGKNFSLVYRGDKPELAPVYDVLSTHVYGDVDSKMAMKIGGTYKPKEVYLKHFEGLLGDMAPARKTMQKRVKKMCDSVRHKAPLLKDALEVQGLESPIYDEIIAMIEKRTARLTDSI